jgi:esterase/lipase
MIRQKLKYNDLIKMIPGALELLEKPKPKVLYIHGVGGSKNSPKATAIRFKGYDFVAPTFPKLAGDTLFSLAIPFLNRSHWNRSIAITKDAIEKEKPDVVVGSSMGGALAMEALQEMPHIPQVLISPAWKFFGVKPKLSDIATIIHGDRDVLVNVKDSEKLAKKNPNANLIVIPDDHRANKHVDKIACSVRECMEEIGKRMPNSIFLKDYCATVKPNGNVHLSNGSVVRENDEVIVDTNNRTIQKVYKKIPGIENGKRKTIYRPYQ